jgi:hypothetical protein
MIANLTIIVAVYVIIRLATIALRQVPEVERHLTTQVTVAVFSLLAIVLVLLCTLDTLGVGLNLGSALDAKRGGVR